MNPALADLLETTIAHVLPGTIFLIYGLWWTLISSWTDANKKLINSYHRSLRRAKEEDGGDNDDWQYRSWLPQFTCCKVPLEPLVKTLLPLIGIIEECMDVGRDPSSSRTYLKLYRVINHDGTFNDLSQLQHITMYSSFLISGLVDLASLRIKLPRHASQVLLAVAFLVEATLFHFHTPAGSVTFSDHLHSMLALIVFGCAVFSALRIWMPVNLLVNMG